MTDAQFRHELAIRGLVAVNLELLKRDLRPGLEVVDARDPLGVVIRDTTSPYSGGGAAA